MGSLGIKIYGDEILREKAADIEAFDEELGELVKNMVETMIVEEGVGRVAASPAFFETMLEKSGSLAPLKRIATGGAPVFE